MENKCAVICDLLPLYIDDVCSEESKKMVEEHLAECSACRAVLENMQNELPTEPVPIPKQETVLKQTAWHMHKRAIGSAVGVTAIVLYWLIYLWQDSLANAGDYRYFPYIFHEIYSTALLWIPLLTLLWLGKLFYKTVKKRAWRKNAVLLTVLAFLLAGQIGYFYNQSQLVDTTCWTEVVEIPDNYHVVIQNGERTVTLSTAPVITKLLRTDGTVYGFYYESKRDTPTKGQLNGIWDVVE